MRPRSTLVLLWTKIAHLPQKYTIPVIISIVYLLLYVVTFLVSKPVVFSYADVSCTKHVTLLPALYKDVNHEQGYIAQPSGLIKIGSVPIAAMNVCFVPTRPPHVGTTKVSYAPSSGWLMRESFAINVSSAPTMSLGVLTKAVSTSRSMDVPLSKTDRMFTYYMSSNGRQVRCDSKIKLLSCDIEKLGLKQGVSYPVEVLRYFKREKVTSLTKRQITTLPATHVIDSSIKSSEIVYNKSRSITLTFDKKIAKINPVIYKVENGKHTSSMAVNSTIKNDEVQLEVDVDLARSTNYELVLDKVEAIDGSGLDVPYTLAFSTSGGPKVTGVNVYNTGVAMGATVVITFDQNLSEEQDISKEVTISGGIAPPVRRGAQLLLTLAGVPMCGDFSIKLSNELESSYGVRGNSAWSFAGRMTCHTVSTIGYSSRGRPINAYLFGAGSNTVLFTGAIHGNEISTKNLMDRWIGELEANARSIPANKRVIVIPQLNPDGVSMSSRLNAHNVDLNRNFATSDWKSDITTLNNQPFPGGGGGSVMSEPETQVIASFVQRVQPSLVMSYHSVGAVVAANQAGRSNTLVNVYSQLSGYRNTTGQTGSTFEYAISGTADDWYAEKLGIASILVELGSSVDSQFSRNQKAMWAMLNS